MGINFKRKQGDLFLLVMCDRIAVAWMEILEKVCQFLLFKAKGEEHLALSY